VTTPLTNPTSTIILNTYSKFFLVDDKGIANPTKEYAKQKPESYVDYKKTHSIFGTQEQSHIVECGWITTSLPSVLSRVTGENRRPLYQRYASVHGVPDVYAYSGPSGSGVRTEYFTYYYISETCTQDKAAECVKNTDNVLIRLAGERYFNRIIDAIQEKQREQQSDPTGELAFLRNNPIFGGRRTQKRSKARSKARSKSKSKSKAKARSRSRV
jgi:hypothetical protein